MSYCRFSSDDFQCDVYVYASVYGGYQTHVAGSRYVYKQPLPPQVPFDKEHIDAWMKRDRKVKKMLDEASIVPIGLPHDGECFADEMAADAAKRLQALKEIGYNVPQYAIDALLTEAKEDR